MKEQGDADLRNSADEWAEALNKEVRRRRLVLVHLGYAFAPWQEQIAAAISQTQMSAIDYLTAGSIGDLTGRTLVLHDVQGLAATDASGVYQLGALRKKLNALLDGEVVGVCLLSTVSRPFFVNIPGSSILDDAFLFILDPQYIDPQGTPDMTRGWSCLPGVETESGVINSNCLEAMLREVGTETLAALDAALFEADLRFDFVHMLNARDTEALRSTGVLTKVSNEYTLRGSRGLIELKRALSEVLANTTKAQRAWPEVCDNIWTIERILRRMVRRTGISLYGEKWRKQLLNADLSRRAMQRAVDDAYPLAKSVAELRDPIEWLSLGELLEVVTGPLLDQLGVAPPVWRIFANQVLPIRNRISHMRLLKEDDREVSARWRSTLEQKFN